MEIIFSQKEQILSFKHSPMFDAPNFKAVGGYVALDLSVSLSVSHAFLCVA